MRSFPLLSCLSAAALLSACAPYDHGHYDANGNWVPPANATTPAQYNHAPDPGAMRDDYDYRDDLPRHHHRVYKTTTTTYSYDRPGYYDYNGYYISEEAGLGVPEDMFPPRGVCRIWFPDREPGYQPKIESCEGIQYRVPAGAYVIYGG